MKASIARVLARSIVLAVLATSAGDASEPRADLEIQAGLTEIVPVRADASRGYARIDLVVEAFRETREIVLTVERPDGSVWRFADREIRVEGLDWSDTAGAVVASGPDGIVIPARGALRSRIEVPLDGRAVHEIVVRATGASGGETLSATAVVRAPLGVPLALPVDDGTYANYTLTEVK